MRRVFFVSFTVVCIPLGFLLLSRVHRVPMTDEPLAQEVYVWQQKWSGSTLSSLADHIDLFANSVLLVTEIQWENGRPTTRHVDLPLDRLQALNAPLGMAIRMGPIDGSFAADSAAVPLLVDVVQDRLSRWREAGIQPGEIQIDFDCPESKLRQYREWLDQIRPATDGVKLTITALPAWLDQPAFAALAEATDGFVLQVHFYQMPTHPSETVTLCDPGLATRSVRAAARIQKPFRVALPTYGYRVFFRRDNSVLGIAAEGSTRDWLGARTARELRADANQLAALVRSWNQQHPEALEGIIWFRMPVSGDTLNWSWPVLSAVMTGRAPTSQISLQTITRDNGLVEVVAMNLGEADAPLPTTIEASWNAGDLIAADGINSFAVTARRRQGVALQLDRSRSLSAKERLTVAWFRFRQSTEVTIDY